MASTASGLAMRLSAANNWLLIAMSSNTASITMSASATAPRSVVPAIRAIRASASAAASVPREAALR